MPSPTPLHQRKPTGKSDPGEKPVNKSRCRNDRDDEIPDEDMKTPIIYSINSRK